MTNEQREAIEYIQKQIDYFKEQIKFIEAVDCDYYEEEYELYKNRIKQFSTVLSLIKEQDKYIKDANDITTEMSNDIKKLTSEIKKKDKQIDLMADEIIMTKPINCTKTNEFSTKKIYMSKEEIKQYFADLVEKE